MNQISTSDPQKWIYTSDEKKEIKTLYKDMTKIPMIPQDIKHEMEKSLICNWLIRAAAYLGYKHSKQGEETQNVAVSKKSYKKWMSLESEIHEYH